MQDVHFYLAVLNALVVVPICVYLALGCRSIRDLQDIEPFEPSESDQPAPLITIVVTARNEEKNIEPAIRSLINQDYPSLEYLLINDRSTDHTGEILDRLADEFPQLEVLHLTELPAGWLGKNHAMQRGMQAAHGELILYTDADVVMQPTTLRRAYQYMQQTGVDHLPIGPSVTMPNWLLESFTVMFLVAFSAFARPWKAKDPKSTASVGVGAFNLIRADVLRKIGGMEPIAMRPDDDIKLGKLVKKEGYRQEFLNGVGMISVPWYGSLKEVIVGLEKNTFAALEYNISLVVFSTLVLVVFDLWPFFAIWLPLGPARWVYLVSVVAMLTVSFGAASGMEVRRSAALGFPIALALFIYIQWRSMILAITRGGIQWRDTFYSLDELKSNRI